jgi:hypothetical protein
MEFDWDFQELKKFEQVALVYTRMTTQLMKLSLKFQICEFIDLHAEI